MKSALRVCLGIAAGAVVALAAGDAVRGPVAGLLVDAQSGAIRPILGSAGSAYAGAPAVSGVTFAVAAADGDQALVARDGSLSLLRRLGVGAPIWLTLREEASGLGLAAFSRSGAAVALHDSSHHRLQLWNDLKTSPEPAGEIDLNGLSGRLVSLAVDDNGSAVFAAFQESDSAAALYRLQPNQAPKLLMTLDRAGVLVLDGDSLYAADRGRQSVHRLTGWNDSLQVATIANEGHGLVDPVGVAPAQDGRTVYIASAGTRQVLAIDAREQTVKAAIDLGFVPSGLQPSGNVLLLTPGVPGVAPAQVLDPVRFEVFFVPVSALPAPVESGASGH